jgi:hypothetical protein
MGSMATFVAKEIREALAPTLFFLLLFHLIALTKAVSLGDYSIVALRAVNATIGALIVAKAILVVEALPLSRLFPGRRAIQILWKTLLYSLVVLVFRVVDEAIPMVSKHGGLLSAGKAMVDEVSWPLFVVVTLWVFFGLLLYEVIAELVRAVGVDRVRALFFGTGGARGADRPA